MTNREIRLASRPTGTPTLETFEFVDIDVPQPADGEVLARLLFVWVNAYLRGRMRAGSAYIAPFEVGEPIKE